MFTFTSIHFLAKTIFPVGIGGGGCTKYIVVVKILEGWGVYFSGLKWKFHGGGGGDLSKIASMLGVWVFSRTTH